MFLVRADSGESRNGNSFSQKWCVVFIVEYGSAYGGIEISQKCLTTIIYNICIISVFKFLDKPLRWYQDIYLNSFCGYFVCLCVYTSHKVNVFHKQFLTCGAYGNKFPACGIESGSIELMGWSALRSFLVIPNR